MRRQKLIDVETAGGMAEFSRMAAKTDAFKRSRGMGAATDADLLKTIAFNLELPKEDSESGESCHYQGSLNDAKLLRQYASKRVYAHAWQKGSVLDVLRKLAEQGDAHALELIGRAQGDRGLRDGYQAEAAYYTLHADERELNALAYKQAGNPDAERLAKEVARVCRRLAKVLRGEGNLRPRKEAKDIDRRIVKARDRLNEYEKTTAGMAWLSPEEKAVVLRLAAKNNMTEKNYRKRITDARKARAKSPSGGTAKRAQA